jgi:hypothetical protein
MEQEVHSFDGYVMHAARLPPTRLIVPAFKSQSLLPTFVLQPRDNKAVCIDIRLPSTTIPTNVLYLFAFLDERRLTCYRPGLLLLPESVHAFSSISDDFRLDLYPTSPHR